MRRSAVLLVLAIASLAGATEEKYTFSIGGQPAGTGTLTFTKLPNGGTQFTIDLRIEFAGQTGHQRQQGQYDKNARPTAAAMLEEQGGNKIEYKLVYGATSVTQSTTTNGKSKEKVVRCPPHKSITEPSQLWFTVRQPAPHAISNEVEYDPRSGKWVSHKRIFVGSSQIVIGGQKVKAFEIQDKNLSDGTVMTQWLDGHGMPYRIDFPSAGAAIRMERAKS